MRETTKALVQSSWGYQQGSEQATAGLLNGKDVMVLSYKVGTVIDAQITDGKVVLTIQTEVPDGRTKRITHDKV